MHSTPFRLTGSAVALALMLTSGIAQADTLQDALARAYQHNPILAGARADLRSTDENVPIARASGLPSASADASYNENFYSSNRLAADRGANASVNLSVPVYSGGSVKNAVRAADTRVEAGRANLRATEASIFSQTVAVYMDVIRDEAIVALNRANVNVLTVNLRATEDRFEIGDLTRTDVAQSRARLALAKSDYEVAQANLISSRERYIQVVGAPPVDLAPPPPLPNMPASVIDAEEIALANNPDIEAAVRLAEASRYDINAARSSRLPRVSVFAGGNHNNSLGSGSTLSANSNTSAQLGVSVQVPLYQGGGPAARIRKAQATAESADEQVIAVERDVIATVRAAYSSWQASNEVITSAQIAVDANKLSLEGVRAENTVGNRTILDILNAEQELLSSEVQLVRARRDAYVAGFTLLAAMGLAEADDLGIEGGALYDPTLNYNEVRNNIWDWSNRPLKKPSSTRTIDTRPQTSEIGPFVEPK